MSDKLPQTFEEWRQQHYRTLALGVEPPASAAFAAGVASQQAEIERWRSKWDVEVPDLWRQLAEKDGALNVAGKANRYYRAEIARLIEVVAAVQTVQRKYPRIWADYCAADLDAPLHVVLDAERAI